MNSGQFRLRTLMPLVGDRKSPPLFVTLSGESEEQLQTKIKEMNDQGFTQIGAIVFPGPAEYICLMSGYPEDQRTDSPKGGGLTERPKDGQG